MPGTVPRQWILRVNKEKDFVIKEFIIQWE